jgi:hypothetical protein
VIALAMAADRGLTNMLQAYLDAEVDELQLVLLAQLPCLVQHQAQLACHVPHPCHLHCDGCILAVAVVCHTNSSVLQEACKNPGVAWCCEGAAQLGDGTQLQTPTCGIMLAGRLPCSSNAQVLHTLLILSCASICAHPQAASSAPEAAALFSSAVAAAAADALLQLSTS